MDYEWIGKTNKIKFNEKNENTVKIEVKFPHLNKKPQTSKQFVIKHRFLTLL